MSAAIPDDPPIGADGDGTASDDGTSGRAVDGEGSTRRGRTIGAGVAGFVAVHLLALLVLEDPSLPALAGVEALAVGLLFAGDAATVGTGRALPAGAGVLAALVAAGVARGPLATAPWIVAVGLPVVAGSLLYAVHRYDRSVLGGEPA